MKKTFFSSFIVLLLICSAVPVKKAHAQSDTRGTDFWVCFPQNAKEEFNSGLHFKLYITGDHAAKGRVEVPNKPAIPFAITAGEIISIDIDSSEEIKGSEMRMALGIHVLSDNPIAVYGLSNRKASTDTYVAFPTNVLGTAYRAMCYSALAGTEDAFTSQIDIIATEDNTQVTIFPTANTKGGKIAGQQFTVTLTKGDVYQMQSTTRGDGRSDLTGTLVTSDKPIAFLTGHRCAQVPANVNFCDQLLEEEAPINTWGKQFFVSKLLGKDWYVVRIVANEDDTKIFINEKFITSLAAGEFYEAHHLTDNVMIKSDKPILVGEFATSSDADSVKIGDPFLMLITPTEQFLSSYRFVTPIGQAPLKFNTGTLRKKMNDSVLNVDNSVFHYSENYLNKIRVEDSLGTGWHHYINIIVPISALNSLRLDSNGISSDKFTAIGITRYAIGQMEIPYGSRTLTCDRPFGLYSYGFGIGGDNYDSYGNSAGQRVVPIERFSDTAKPTLELAKTDSTNVILLIARDDRINDLGLATIMIMDSSNFTNPIAYPVFDIGAPVFKFTILKPTPTGCLYIKLKDFARNESNYSLCPAATNTVGGANEVAKYTITPILLQQQAPHEVYAVDIYPSPAKFGQAVNISFTNSLPEFIAVQVLDEGGNIVTDLQKKQLNGSGKHSLIYNSDRYSAGSYFLRFTVYSTGDQIMYKQDNHFVVVH